ncbi:helix-turn-helix domain-containing protein [Streptomyces sp. NPDC057287]|uniref:helix-turn-helix domain-containing protein n=1 Tax=Streptomyces sp. NPDC057287 TaxID=3346086 RepID=UPI0036409050
MRLTGAHADLKAADPHSSSVTAIAARWGFAHAGRFAAAYRQLYATPPADTLHTRS